LIKRFKELVSRVPCGNLAENADILSSRPMAPWPHGPMAPWPCRLATEGRASSWRFEGIYCGKY